MKKKQQNSREEKYGLGRWVFGIFLGLWVFGLLGIGEAAQQPASIPEKEITTLQDVLAEGVAASTTAQSRRAYKSVIRQAQALLTATPDASNRFDVLGVIFDGQKRLLPLENNDQNREALFATAQALLEAPDEFAELRLGADLLFMEKSMGEQESTLAERSRALTKLLASYRGTPAEWKSLMIGSVIATKLLDYDVVSSIEGRMLERFAGDHDAIQYRHAKQAIVPLDVVFSGDYRAADGAAVSLPFDRWGRQYIAYFWSETTPRIDDYLREAKELQKAHPGRFEVISFNVDALPDAGQKKLRSLGLDWLALHVPGGRGNSACRAYARTDPCAMLVNAQGHVLLSVTPRRLGITAVEGVREGADGMRLSDLTWALDDERYLSQLRYLFIGDFLAGSGEWPDFAKATSDKRVTSGEDPGAHPAAKAGDVIPDATLQAVQECFVAPPLRYRMTRKEELDNYVKAEKLCADTIAEMLRQAQHDKPSTSESEAGLSFRAQSRNLYFRNCRIIALIGMWNLAGESKHLEEAVKESKTVLAMDLPAGADVVARFCLVKAALRQGGDPERLLADFILACGGDEAPPSALAAATTLSLEANARSAHERYRTRLLALGEVKAPGVWPVRAFLLDRLHRFRNFWASPGGHNFDDQLSSYGYRHTVSGLLDPPPREPPLTLELQKRDGGRLTIPKDMPNRMLAVIFAEPSGDADVQKRAMERASGFAGDFRRQGIDVVVALLTDDINTAKTLFQGTNNYQVALVPGGLKNPLVRKLGILSADRIPNMFLLRPDGTLAWTLSGLDYRYGDKGGGSDLPIRYAIANNSDKLKTDPGFEALERGEYKTALERFAAFSPHYSKNDWWISDRRHGNALAFMGLKDWTAALKAVDGAIDARRWVFRQGLCGCHGIVEMLLTKAAILERLGRGDEAETVRDEASKEVLPHAVLAPGDAFRLGVPVGVYYDWLKRIRLGMDGAGGP